MIIITAYPGEYRKGRGMILYSTLIAIKKAWRRLNGEELSKKDIKNIKELISKRKGI